MKREKNKNRVIKKRLIDKSNENGGLIKGVNTTKRDSNWNLSLRHIYKICQHLLYFWCMSLIYWPCCDSLSHLLNNDYWLLLMIIISVSHILCICSTTKVQLSERITDIWYIWISVSCRTCRLEAQADNNIIWYQNQSPPESRNRPTGPDSAETYLLPDVLVGHVAGAGLGDEASFLRSAAAAVPLVLVLCQTGQQETVRQEALPGQHDPAHTHTHTH